MYMFMNKIHEMFNTREIFVCLQVNHNMYEPDHHNNNVYFKTIPCIVENNSIEVLTEGQ